MIICAKCGKEMDENEAININDEFYCDECVEDMGYVQCRDCGKWFLATEGYEYNGQPLCEDCYEAGYFTCEECGNVAPSDEANYVKGREYYICDDCAESDDYATCIDCGDLFRVHDGRFDENGDFLCDECYEWHGWITCEDCGCYVRSDDAVEIGDEWYCESCAGDYQEFDTYENECCDVERPDRVLNHYSFKPKAVVCKRTNEADTALTAGCEIEVDGSDTRLLEIRESVCKEIKDYTDRVYMKTDGSLNNGFEIVTHPGTLAHHMYEMPYRFIFSKCLKAGFRSHDAGTCGLHIHIGRKQLGTTDTERDAAIRKVIVIVNRFWDEMVRFSRRRENQLHWASRNYIEGYRPDTVITDEWAERRIRTCNGHESRYVAVNCGNEATIEFRIFRGTLKRDTVIASIQLCMNICQYAMTHTWDEIQHSTFLDVAQYKHFNELDAYLAVRELAPVAPLPQNTRRTPDFGGDDGI